MIVMKKSFQINVLKKFEEAIIKSNRVSAKYEQTLTI